jgi:hypothetical protein
MAAVGVVGKACVKYRLPSEVVVSQFAAAWLIARVPVRPE